MKNAKEMVTGTTVIKYPLGVDIHRNLVLNTCYFDLEANYAGVEPKSEMNKRNFTDITEIVARNSLQIMNLCRDEKLSLNYYSTGSLNQWRAKKKPKTITVAL